MNASKENCSIALGALADLIDLTGPPSRRRHSYKLLRSFLEAAQRKLPSESSFTTAAQRRESKRKPK